MSAVAVALAEVYRELGGRLAAQVFGPPVAYVYNPLEYAWRTHQEYLFRFLSGPRQLVLVGMNPGPWGMAQTGVPFGEVEMVRSWLGIVGEVGKPARQHPRRPVEGFACRRREVSGYRLWGWAREVWGSAERFASQAAVLNYCPLLFLDADGRNLTPDRLPAVDRERLETACDGALRAAVELLNPRLVIGVGTYARRRAATAVSGLGVTIGEILHPSPANPRANRDWAGHATAQLRQLGVVLPLGGTTSKAEPLEA